MRKYNRNEFTFKILETIGHLSLSTVDILDRLTSGGKYLSKEEYRDLRKRRNKRHADWNVELERMRDKQNFYSLLYKLQKSGLIEKKKRKNKDVWIITEKGENKKDLISSQYSEAQLLRKKYSPEPSQDLIIVIFDISEKEKRKREWLRSVLRNLDFQILQKSVWMGKNKLPQELLSDLEKLGILSSVKVFSVLSFGNI
ncbi:MAG: hypothetical protein AAB847_02525 [Patescibacteria group bacterium]